MSRESESSVDYFRDGFSCSQAVLVSHCEKLGLERPLAYRVAGAFGGGMGHIGETCGAVTGALMLIGLKYGKFKKEDLESKERTYKIVGEYTNQFKIQNGSIKCKDLIGYDISNEQELIEARKSGVFQNKCPLLVKCSIEIVEQYL